MTDALKHRGPDAGAVYRDGHSGLEHGRRRLAIVDLSERGAQPMHSQSGRFVLAFSGEFYSHASLRCELETSGTIEWRDGSDTETLLSSSVAWGVAVTLKKAVGIIALALLDRAERRLTLARDSLGEKPLFFLVSSAGCHGTQGAQRAHPAFDNSIDRGALALYLRFSYVPAPHTTIANVFKLEPGPVLRSRPKSYRRANAMRTNTGVIRICSRTCCVPGVACRASYGALASKDDDEGKRRYRQTGPASMSDLRRASGRARFSICDALQQLRLRLSAVPVVRQRIRRSGSRRGHICDHVCKSVVSRRALRGECERAL